MRISPRIHVVTVKLADSDSDDCFCRTFRDGHSALEFAADCVEKIDKSRWHDCLCNTDGRVREALCEFNEGEHFANGSGLMGCAVVTVSTEFDKRQILAACSGDSEWYNRRDDA